VVILDNRMPGLTGIEVAEQILAERPEQIVILYSAFVDPAVRQESVRLGVAACVSKGDHRALPELVRRLASESPQGA
jgi:DNA-binding NarL/FixJ family response regulator